MRLGGFTPFTLTDFPGEIAAICFTQGCNFSCPFCHNKLLIPACPGDNNLPNQKEAQKVIDFLALRKGRLHGLVVSGGEPTLQENLTEFLSEVRALGYKIKLDTNGSRPQVLELLLQKGLLDMVAMDIKAPWDKYALLAGKRLDTDKLKSSLRLILESKVDHIFRTTFVPHLLTKEDIEAIRQSLPPDVKYVVQPYVEQGLAA